MSLQLQVLVHSSVLIITTYRKHRITVDESQQVSAPPKIWIAPLKLYETDKDAQQGGLMTVSSSLLKKQFPELCGFQDVGLGQVMNFNIYDGEFLQILYSVNHWVAISTIGMQHPNVKLYDSHYSCLTMVLQAQIAALLCTEHEEIDIHVMSQVI